MTDLTAAQAAELRGELAELRTRVDELEERLNTRIAAAELKQKNDADVVREQLALQRRDIAALRGDLGNVESLLRANHLAEIHLWGVTARLLKLPEAEVKEAQQHARKLLDDAPRSRTE